MKHDLSSSVRDSIKKDWLAHWKARLGNPDGASRQILRMYIEKLDIMVANLNDAMEWDCWVDKDYDLPPDDTSV